MSKAISGFRKTYLKILPMYNLTLHFTIQHLITSLTRRSNPIIANFYTLHDCEKLNLVSLIDVTQQRQKSLLPCPETTAAQLFCLNAQGYVLK